MVDMLSNLWRGSNVSRKALLTSEVSDLILVLWLCTLYCCLHIKDFGSYFKENVSPMFIHHLDQKMIHIVFLLAVFIF